MRALTLAALTAVAAGCTEGALDPSYRGEPLATLQGRIVVPSGADAPKNVRLAMVWYAARLELRQPNSIVTEDVAYEGSFPASFSFHFYLPPPAQALVRNADGSGHEAFGILVAYVDGNDNQRLDSITRGVEPVDTLLGATASFFDTSATSAWVQYTDVEPPRTWPAGSRKGFNLISQGLDAKSRLVSTRLSFESASIPLLLSGEKELNALLCQVDALHVDAEEISPNPLAACGLTPTPNVLRVGISLSRKLTDTASSTMMEDLAKISVSDGLRWITNATVLVNETPATHLGSGDYELREPLRSGENRVRVNGPGFEPRSFTVELPDQGPLTSPAHGARLTSGSSLKLEWPAAGVLSERLVTVLRKDRTPLYSRAGVDDSELTSSTSGPLVYVGEATVRMVARGPAKTDRFGSAASSVVSHERVIQFVP